MNNLLIPTYDLPQAYRRGDIIGAFMDTDTQPSHLRKIARRAHDEARNDLSGYYRFATAPKQNWTAGTWKGKRALLWKSWSTLDRLMALMGAQLTGDCVSWGERCKQEIRRSVEILNGEREAYKKRQATCLLYAGRGHTGDGASPIGIANYATKCGILLEDKFIDADGKTWDFSEYSNYVNLGIRYGRTGFPRSVLDITSKNRVLGSSKVESTDELFDLMINGYASSVGFSIDTAPEGNPVSRFHGTTAHETCFVGFDDTPEARYLCKQSLGYEDTVVMLDQSWGNWNRVTNIPEIWQPWGQGMYCHSARDAQKLIDEGETMTTTGSIDGFKATPINNLLI